jgi:hypothetical protein
LQATRIAWCTRMPLACHTVHGIQLVSAHPSISTNGMRHNRDSPLLDASVLSFAASAFSFANSASSFSLFSAFGALSLFGAHTECGRSSCAMLCNDSHARVRARAALHRYAPRRTKMPHGCRCHSNGVTARVSRRERPTASRSWRLDMSERRERAGHNQRRAVKHEPHCALVLRRDLRGVRVRRSRVIGLTPSVLTVCCHVSDAALRSGMAFLSAVRHCTPRCAQDIVGIAPGCHRSGWVYCRTFAH